MPGERVAPPPGSGVKPRARELGCVTGSGNLDLPGSSNWYVPDIAVVPAADAKGAGALLPDQTLLVVEVTSESNAETDRASPWTARCGGTSSPICAPTTGVLSRPCHSAATAAP